jgi:hypothetical protein
MMYMSRGTEPGEPPEPVEPPVEPIEPPVELNMPPVDVEPPASPPPELVVAPPDSMRPPVDEAPPEEPPAPPEAGTAASPPELPPLPGAKTHSLLKQVSPALQLPVDEHGPPSDPSGFDVLAAGKASELPHATTTVANQHSHPTNLTIRRYYTANRLRRELTAPAPKRKVVPNLALPGGLELHAQPLRPATKVARLPHSLFN